MYFPSKGPKGHSVHLVCEYILSRALPSPRKGWPIGRLVSNQPKSFLVSVLEKIWQILCQPSIKLPKVKCDIQSCLFVHLILNKSPLGVSWALKILIKQMYFYLKFIFNIRPYQDKKKILNPPIITLYYCMY